MTACDIVTWRLVSQNRGRSVELEPVAWEFELLRNRIGAADLTVSACVGLDSFEPWCDLLEVAIGNEVAATYAYTNPTDGRAPGTIRLHGIGQTELLRKRRHATATQYLGDAGSSWRKLWDDANAIAATGLQSELTGGGPLLDFTQSAGDAYNKPASTLSSFVTFTEHGGAMYEWLAGTEPEGRPLTDDWALDFGCSIGAADADAVANDIEIAYGVDLDQTVRYPLNGIDTEAGCRLQSPRLEFPEITTRVEALALAERWQPLLAVPEPLLEDVALDPSETRLIDLVPGVWHRDIYSPHTGQRFNLDSAVLSGVSECVTEITASFDQGDSTVRGRVRST